MKRGLLVLLTAAIASSAGQALGWGATGHEWATGIAIEKLPEDVPAFVRDPAMLPKLALMGRELDRSKGSGETHDKERDPGHYVDVSDDGKVMGVLPLDQLPVTREAYDTKLRAGGSNQYQAGYLPYSIIDGWQQLRKDFAYWRADVRGIETASSPEERAWFEADRRLREKLTLRDIGIWSHYVADASQPLHVSVHYNGWGDFPNPQGFTTKHIHAYFEGVFVRKNLKREAVAALVRNAYSTPLDRGRRRLLRFRRACLRRGDEGQDTVAAAGDAGAGDPALRAGEAGWVQDGRRARHRVRHREAGHGRAIHPRHDRGRVERQRDCVRRLPDGERARHRKRKGAGDARADGRGLTVRCVERRERRR